MSETIKKGLLLEGAELGTVGEQMLGPKAVSVAKPQAVNRHRPLFFLTHLFCCGCCPCKACGRNDSNSNANINLPPEPKNMCLVPSSFTTLTSGNVLQMSSKFSGPATYQSVFNSDSKQRCKFRIANFCFDVKYLLPRETEAVIVKKTATDASLFSLRRKFRVFVRKLSAAFFKAAENGLGQLRPIFLFNWLHPVLASDRS
uniref:Uncharacterized protein n=1 Tax=Elaeophora elaphi TaxID=1147741 RepID=A0A0R3RQ45_9BILA